MHKIALHAAGRTIIGYLVATALGNHANNTIQDILTEMPEDLQTLQWFRNQLVEVYNKPLPLKNVLSIENEVLGKYITKEKFNELLSNKDLIAEASLLKLAGKRFIADEQFLAKNRDYWQNYFSTVKAALDLPYEQAFAELKSIEDKTKKDVTENPDATMTAILAAPFSKIYSQQTAAKNFSNALMVAVKLYVIKAKDGNLPDKLPENLPKDLFSGKPFEYSKTDNGFTLRCRGKDLSDKNKKTYEYEFKL
jgi:hypothetical protein